MYNGRALKKADPSTIQDKLLVGYQGWFTCAGDGEPGTRRSPISRSTASACLLTLLILSICLAPPFIDCELHITRLIVQLEEAITDGSTGSITPSRMADARILTSGRTCQNMTVRNSTKHRDSEPGVAKNAICSPRGIRRL